MSAARPRFHGLYALFYEVRKDVRQRSALSRCSACITCDSSLEMVAIYRVCIPRTGREVLKFLNEDVEAGVFEPYAVRILVAAFDAAWQSVQSSGAHLTDKEIELTRATLAKYIIAQARQGERDEARLRDSALLHLAQPNLRKST